MKNKYIPVGVKVISILYYIGVVGLVALAILSFIGTKAIGLIMPVPELLTSSILIVMGIIFLAFAVLSFFIGYGLWKSQKWARIVAIIFAIIGVIMYIISLVGQFTVSPLIMLIIDSAIAGYLLFAKEVKKAFA
ncbi:MAG: DUF2127 domain-containing protein [Candidatus Pacearchaeota archaeon]|jgi:hypothetical protein